MRVGLLTSDLSARHGWGQYSLSLLRALQKQGAEIIAITAQNSLAIPEVDIHPLLPDVVPFAPRLSWKLLRVYPAVRHLLADCDVIHSTVEFYAPLAWAVAGKRPLFLTAHGSYAWLPRKRPFPLNRIYQRAYEQSQIICVSRYTEQVIRQVVPAARTQVIPNGVDSAYFESFPDLSARPDQPIILTSGGVKARKGTLQLVRAVARVREQIPDVQCVVIGTLTAEPRYVEQVQREIERLQLGDHIRLTGFVEQHVLEYWYATARLFVLPSINDGWKFEGFGLVNLEASAAGLPVIGTTGCGAADAVDHGVTGLLVSQENIEEELPRAVLTLLTDQQQAQAMGAAGREKARRQTWDQAARQVLQIYETALL